jgi:hypothetical protein
MTICICIVYIEVYRSRSCAYFGVKHFTDIDLLSAAPAFLQTLKLMGISSSIGLVVHVPSGCVAKINIP